jgi:hypothetical protein
VNEVDAEPIAQNRRRHIDPVLVVGYDPGLEDLIADGDGRGDRGEDDPRRQPSPARRVFKGGAGLRICGVRIDLVQ